MNPITILELRRNITFQTVQINRELNKVFFSLLMIISIICNYGSNGHENLFCFEERGSGEEGGKQAVLWVGFDRLC